MTWLPPAHHRIVYTLAQVDKHLSRAAETYYRYAGTGKPFELEQQIENDRHVIRVAEVRPIPVSLALDTADALTQMRAAVEHTVYTEVEVQLGRALTSAERRRVEMPAHDTLQSFRDWQKKQKSLSVFESGQPLGDRIESLQPFNSPTPNEHPMKLLAEHTNQAKHRTPLVAAARIGKVVPDRRTQTDVRVLTTNETTDPVQVGDEIGSVPRGAQISADIWPEVSIERPHTGSWHVLSTELQKIEEWCRLEAIPTLIGAPMAVVQPLPVTVGLGEPAQDLEAVIDSVGQQGSKNAFVRMAERIQADIARVGVLDVLSLHNPGKRDAFIGWVTTLTNDRVMSIHRNLASVVNDPYARTQFLEELSLRAFEGV